jgi:DtxR family Mn-dependent transcriptional regulator
MPSSTVENYLKCLYHQELTTDGPVAMGQLASAMGVAPGTATAMVKTLAEAGLVHYEPRGGVGLSPTGRRLALHVLRRHRLIELFLVQVLGLDWSEVHDEAEELEHAISDKVLTRIDALLGHPSVDPHGDPIPTARGSVHTPHLASLADCLTDRPMRIARILDQDPRFLRFLDQSGLTPGSEAVVQNRDVDADAVTLQNRQSRQITIGTAAAAKILVEPAAG